MKLLCKLGTNLEIENASHKILESAYWDDTCPTELATARSVATPDNSQTDSEQPSGETVPIVSTHVSHCHSSNYPAAQAHRGTMHVHGVKRSTGTVPFPLYKSSRRLLQRIVRRLNPASEKVRSSYCSVNVRNSSLSRTAAADD